MSPEPSTTAGHHHPALAHHFDDLGQQTEASTLGMWLFLVTEVLFFGGALMAYSIYRSWYPEAFAVASHELDITLGTINTVVLILSSLTMALAVHAAQTNDRGRLMTFLVITMLLGLTFLGIKSVEYYTKFVEHHVPGPSFQFEAGVLQTRADLLLDLLRADRVARHSHDHRARHHDLDVHLGEERDDRQGLHQSH